MINFYHRFFPAASKIMHPLFSAISGKPTDSVQWTDAMVAAFTSTKNALASTTQLCHPEEGAETAITVDASDTTLGGVLQQHLRGIWRPIGFFSRVHHAAEMCYSAFDRELLAVRDCICHFRYFMEGRRFSIYMDHKPLTFMMAKICDAWSLHQRRHLLEISEYTTDIRHVVDLDNVVADALSRVTAVSNGVDFALLAASQHSCSETQVLISSMSNLQLAQVPVHDGDVTLLCDVSMGCDCPVVPTLYRRTVFDAIHNLAHPGIHAFHRLLQDKFVWRGMAKDVGNWACQCLQCQCTKVHLHIKAPLQSFRPADSRFSHIHVDVVGCLPSSRGFTHLLTIVDRFIEGPSPHPCLDGSASLGPPWYLYGPQGGPPHVCGTCVWCPYLHPISAMPANEDVASRLRDLRFRVGELCPIPAITHRTSPSFVASDLLWAKFIFVCHGSHVSPLQPSYDGPYEVLAHRHKCFRLRVGSRKQVVSVDRIKVADVDPSASPAVAVPPRRGRPPSAPHLDVTAAPARVTPSMPSVGLLPRRPAPSRRAPPAPPPPVRASRGGRLQVS